MPAQDRTLDQYHDWMQSSAVSHLIRTARTVGIIDALREGQRTASQLCESLSLLPERAALLLDALVAIGIIEKYDEDYALSRAAQLLCQYDDDLGDRRWQRLADHVRGDDREKVSLNAAYFDHAAATQWIHTPAAIQAAEMLDIGGEGEVPSPTILDLGCGSAVWSCAMGHRDKSATITAVDRAGPLAAARSTAESIGLLDRLSTIEGDPLEVELPTDQFDLVIIAGRLNPLGPQQAMSLLLRGTAAAKPGGRVVVIDRFRGPSRPDLAEAVEALKLELDTPEGRSWTLKESEAAFQDAGLDQIQFSFLAASRINLGLMVGKKPS